MNKIHSIVATILLLVACQMSAPLGMTTNIVPASPPTITTSLDIPSDGEVANSLSLQLFAEPLNTDVEAFRQLTYGGGLRRRVVCTSNTVMTVQPYGGIVVLSSTGEWIVFQAIGSAIPLNPTTLTGGLVANTRYWVYIYESGGVAAYTASTTGPDLGLKYKNGDEKYFYLTTFYTDTVGNVFPYVQSDNVYRYSDVYAAGAANDLQVLSAGAATAPTTVTYGNTVPSQSSIVNLFLVYATTAGALRQFEIDTVGSSGNQFLGILPNTWTATAQISVSGGTNFSYRWNGNNSTLSISIVKP